MKREQICEDCGAIHIYYYKPMKSCVRITEISDEGHVVKCGGQLIEKVHKRQRRCSKCNKTGHNARTCKLL